MQIFYELSRLHHVNGRSLPDGLVSAVSVLRYVFRGYESMQNLVSTSKTFIHISNDVIPFEIL